MNQSVDRRGLLALGMSVVGTTLVSCTGRAGAQPAKPSTALGKLPTAPATHEIVGLSFDSTKLEGLSANLINSHHDKNYAGAVKKLNAIRTKLKTSNPSAGGSYWSEFGTLKAGEAAARNSALLHELYFGNLVGPGQTPPANLARALSARFGSVEAMLAQLRGCGASTGGWVILAFDGSSHSLEIVPTTGHRGGAWNSEALLVLDVFEHSYAMDYGPNKGAYIDAFIRNLNWSEVERRFNRAVAAG